jgi:hypothetical protein
MTQPPKMNPMSELLGAMLMLPVPMLAGIVWIVCSNLVRENRAKKRRDAREHKFLMMECDRLQAENLRLEEQLIRAKCARRSA